MLATSFKDDGDGITWSFQTIRASIHRPSGCQGIASPGFVSTRPATILAPSLARAEKDRGRIVGKFVKRSLLHTPADRRSGLLENDKIVSNQLISLSVWWSRWHSEPTTSALRNGLSAENVSYCFFEKLQPPRDFDGFHVPSDSLPSLTRGVLLFLATYCPLGIG